MNMQSWVKKEKIKTLKIKCVRFVIRALYFLPIKKNRIVFFSFEGKQYSCNPKAISEYIETTYPGRFEIIWAFNNTNKHKYLEKHGIKVVKYKSIKRILLQITAKYSINNTGSYSWLPVRKGQHHINTWHAGGAYKRLQHDPNTDYNRKLTAKETTLMISSCKLFTKYNLWEQFSYRGKLLNIGMPRNDILFNKEAMDNKSALVRKKYKIDIKSMVVLFAPTWRYDGNIPCFDIKKVKSFLEEKYGTEVVVMVRNHSLSDKKYNESLDVSDYEDMQDLLCTADILITDYSSSIWDYSFTYKPCFLYVPDLDKYTAEQGFYTDIHTWGFPLCHNDDELLDMMDHYDENEFRLKMDNHHKLYGSYEKGTATKEFCERMFGKVVR